MNLTQWGPDIVANRVRIGVHGLTPKISADLASEFGADLVLVVEGALWRAVWIGRFPRACSPECSRCCSTVGQEGPRPTTTQVVRSGREMATAMARIAG